MVLWLFVLVPMLINKRDNVRRTSDVALSTRVLNVKASRLLRSRRGPAHGHRHDPHWQPEAEEYDDWDEEATGPVVVTAKASQSVAVMNAETVIAEPDYLDVDIVDPDSGALPVGKVAAADTDAFEVVEEVVVEEIVVETAPEEPVAAHDEHDEMTDDEYEYVEDSAGVEPEEAPSRQDRGAPVSRGRGYATKTAARVSARKYRFRSRALLTMCALLALSATAAVVLAPEFWYACAGIAALALIYLSYLRRQTRIEEQLRRRRMARVARSRLGVENTYDREMEVVPTRLRQPGAAVLEIDDEDPIFEHLDEVAFARAGAPGGYDLPRAAGQ
ncbi:hypothetical protein MBRU_02705 [Mycolicibacterium brumae DSM 44177]|nr:hypothetical protein MBRU_02705 [Mycolicibacterium brumae DSM 44177]